MGPLLFAADRVAHEQGGNPSAVPRGCQPSHPGGGFVHGCGSDISLSYEHGVSRVVGSYRCNNKCDEVGPFFPPQTESASAAFAADFKVGDDGCAWCLTLKRCLILKRRLFVKGCW